MTCTEVDDSAPGYALDILDAGRRSLVASHILRCGRCRETVSRTQESADRLLGIRSADDLPQAAPQTWPGDWFTDSYYDADEDLLRPRRRRLRVAATMIAVVALLVGTTLGPELEQAARPAAVPTLAVPLVAGNNAVGSVRVYAGQPPVMQIEVTNLGGRLTLQADLIGADGHIEAFGQFKVVNGRGGWAAAEPRDMADPKSLILADSAGKVLAQAALS